MPELFTVDGKLPKWWWLRPYHSCKMLYEITRALKAENDSMTIQIRYLKLSRLAWANQSSRWESKARENKLSHEAYIKSVEKILEEARKPSDGKKT